jgi:hypothetical protein
MDKNMLFNHEFSRTKAQFAWPFVKFLAGFLPFVPIAGVRKPVFTAWVVALCLALLLSDRPALAQAQIVDASVEYRFGEAITFKARVEAGFPVKAARIEIRKQGDSGRLEAPVQADPGGDLEYHLDLKALEPGQNPPRAFSRVDYVFYVTLDNGEEISSQEFSFFYGDNRFPWKEKESGSIRVHWYEGDEAFAQSVLDAADLGLQKAQDLLSLRVRAEINLFVYANSSEMQSALLAGQNWVAGQTAPDLGVALVSLPPGLPDTRFEARRQIPHELMHILLYQRLVRAYADLPAWLNEGLASMAELSPNADYQTMLENAVRNDALIPMASLCGTFPSDYSSALLSYAESTSFTFFLYRQFGSSGLDKLVNQYADGLDCASGVEAAFGSPLEQLEQRWLDETFGTNAYQQAFGDLMPWAVLLLLSVAVPLGLTLGGLWKWRHTPIRGVSTLRRR